MSAEETAQMEQLVRDFVEASAKVVQSDHDLLTKLVESAQIDHDLLAKLTEAVQTDHDLITKLAEVVTGDSTGMGLISVAKDHEKRLRWAETRLYLAVGALAMIELAIGVLTLLKH
jgi:DhnA family fructose-bisphosphate aldolase class Ia